MNTFSALRRFAWRASAMGLAVLLSACPGLLGTGLTVLEASPEPAASASSRPTQVSGGILVEGTATPGPSAQPSAGPSAAAPTPTPVPGPYAIDVKIKPDRVFLGMRPPADARPLMDHTAQLSATITLSTGLKSSQATWTSTDPTVVKVDATGFIEAQDKKGEALITATSEDGRASGSVRVTVKDDAGTEVLIE